MSKLLGASVSDIHWGHRNTPTRLILENLSKAFPDTAETGRLDFILFGGDQFDRLLTADDEDLDLIKAWWNRFLRMCARREIVVRVLRGTPSHDWRQNWMLVAEQRDSAIPVNLKLIDTLSIEYIEELGINVLYVPDEWRPECDDTWAEVQQLLQQHQLTSVDFSVIHGCFSYQLPPHVTAPRHVPERYMGITDGYVLGAHVHTASTYGDNLLVNGSFDRISHGEEAEKGHWRLEYSRAGGIVVRRATFVVNEGAMKYVTVDCSGMPLEDATSQIRQMARTLPAGSHVRIQAGREDPISQALELMRKQHPEHTWSSKVNKDTSNQVKMLVDMRSSFTQISIQPENIASLMRERLLKRGIDPNQVDRLITRLKEFS